jgi:glutamine amidotransferase
MCELLAMSANVPTDICFSFTGFSPRGGKTGPHRDGFGICFYEHGGMREFKDYLPSCQSPIAKFLQSYPIRSKNVLCHIRQANVGEVNLQNTHPFHRELCGRTWTFAHNGQMPIESVPEPSYYQPVGTTDSEKIFCWILSELRNEYRCGTSISKVSAFLLTLCNRLNQLGVSNILLTDGEDIFAFCSTKLSWITRKAPFGEAHLRDCDVSLDFTAVTNETDIATVIATEPLTDNERWETMKSGEGRVFRDGLCVWKDCGPEVIHKKKEAWCKTA